MNIAYGTHSVIHQVIAVRDGLISAEDLALEARDLIIRAEPELAAWVALSDNIIDQARAASGPLAGVSLGVKDLIDVGGLPTRAGSPVASDGPAAVDAPCVSRFRQLGAVVQGKTVTTEFGYFRPGPTRNPHDPDRTPGGSSSGSAAAVAAGTIPIALGTQTAGSLTRPASYCGIAGLVLAHGATDLTGIAGLSGSLDSLGILSRTVPELHFVYSAFTGRFASAPPPHTIADALVWTGSGLGPLDIAMRRLIEALPELLQEAQINPTALEHDLHVQELARDHATVMQYEAARTLRPVAERSAAQLSSHLKALISAGHVTSHRAYASALTRRDKSREFFVSVLAANSTMIVGPAALGPAPHVRHGTGSPALSRPWQLLGFPVVVVPGARAQSGLPLGLQLIGRPGTEIQLLSAAARLETVLRALPGL